MRRKSDVPHVLSVGLKDGDRSQVRCTPKLHSFVLAARGNHLIVRRIAHHIDVLFVALDGQF